MAFSFRLLEGCGSLGFPGSQQTRTTESTG
jgi:hypothetical protein